MEENAISVPLEHEADEVLSFLDVELNTLKSIYINEIEVTHEADKKSTSVSIDLHPATADNIEKQYVRMNLKLILNDKYPMDIPEISICNPRGLSDEKLNSITQDLISIAEDRKGDHMLYQIIATAKEHLTAENKPCGECAVCLYGFSDEDVFTKTECYHYFHSHCLARYARNSLTEENEDEEKSKTEEEAQKKELLCPVCRLPIQFEGCEDDDYPPPRAADEESVISEQVLEFQAKMADIYQKQLEKGGIIDIEEEKNRYLLEISNVPTRGNAVADEVNINDAISQAEDVPETLQKDKIDSCKETVNKPKSTPSSPSEKAKDDWKPPKFSNLIHAAPKKYDRNTNSKTKTPEERTDVQKESTKESNVRYDHNGTKFSGNSRYQRNDYRYYNNGFNRRYNENYNRGNFNRNYASRGCGRGRYAQNGYDNRNYRDRGYNDRKTFSGNRETCADESCPKSFEKNTSDSNVAGSKESVECRSDIESTANVNKSTEENLAQDTNSTNNEIGHEQAEHYRTVKDSKRYSDRSKSNYSKNQRERQYPSYQSYRGRGGFFRGKPFAHNNPRGHNYKDNRNSNSYFSRNRSRENSESNIQCEAQGDGKGDFRSEKIPSNTKSYTLEGQNRGSCRRNSNPHKDFHSDVTRDRNDTNDDGKDDPRREKMPSNPQSYTLEGQNRRSYRRNSNPHKDFNSDETRDRNDTNDDGKDDPRREKMPSNPKSYPLEGQNRGNFAKNSNLHKDFHSDENRDRNDPNTSHRYKNQGSANSRGRYGNRHREDYRDNYRKDYNRDHYENEVDDDTQRHRNNYYPRSSHTYSKGNQKYTDNKPSYRGSNSYHSGSDSRKYNSDSSRQNGNQFNGEEDKGPTCGFSSKQPELPSNQPLSRESTAEPCKDVPIDSNIKPASSVSAFPQMVGPPPGFKDVMKKVVYGLQAANPPPGFTRS